MSAPPSPAAAAAGPETTSIWRMYRAMVGIGVLCGLMIVTVFELTRPVIARGGSKGRSNSPRHHISPP